jgi:hypothetical protein
MFKADQPIFPNTFQKNMLLNGIPVRQDLLYANSKGEEKPKLREAAEKRLSKLQSPLVGLLGAGEVVLYTASGMAPMNALEQYLFGYMGKNLSRVTLIFTNTRILAFRVDRYGDWRQTVRGCRYSDLSSIKITGMLSRYAKLKFHNGKKVNYWGLSGTEANALKQILAPVHAGSAAELTGDSEMSAYCPSCWKILNKGVYECASCHQVFKSESSLMWRALIPGGAYFYARQRGLGILHAVIDGLLSLDLLFAFFSAAAVRETARPSRSDAWAGVAYLALLVILEKMVAFYHARKLLREFLPVEGTSQRDLAKAAATGTGIV